MDKEVMQMGLDLGLEPLFSDNDNLSIIKKGLESPIELIPLFLSCLGFSYFKLECPGSKIIQ